VAQSALSHQIGRLERELGIPLFERTSRRVTPTEAGEAVAMRARRVMAELEATRQEVDQLRGVLRGHIWVGALQPAGDVDVPGLLAQFSQAFPGVEVSLREGIAVEMFDHLAADELDAAFCLLGWEPAADFAFERLSEDEAVIGMAPARAPRGEYLTVAELAGHRLIGPRGGSAITHAVSEAFAAAGQPFRLSLESGDPFLLRALAAQGFATAILPRSLTALDGPALVVRSLRPAVRLPVALVWRRNRRISPAAQAFIEFVRSATSLIAAR
jgi:LysR family transcriptional regulator, transcription activator of glutamate synthase operon